MKPDERSFSDLVRILRNRARPAMSTAFAVLLLMAAVVFLLPAVYEASATLLIEKASMPGELTGGADAQEYVEQRLQRARQRVLTDENVTSLIEEHQLYGNDPLEDKLVEFNENALITPQVTGVIDPETMRAAELTYAFDVGFLDSNPERAQAIANELADLFVAASSAQAKEEAARAVEFAKAEAERLASDLRQREAKLAQFRQQYPVGLPDDRVRNQERAMSLERELALVDADLRAARGQKDLLEAQLRDTPRDSPGLDASGQVVLRGGDRLVAAQQELVAALAKYSDDHPDVRRLRREIATLTAEVSSTSAAPPTNPAYLQMQTQANAAGVAVRELTARRYELSRSLSTLQGAITLSPKLEEQYTELVRDYEVIKTQYEQMRSQQATAELQVKAAGTAAETYVLINPARIPEDPVQPDRFALMFLAIVLAIAAGLGAAFLINASDLTVRGSADVFELSGVEPFAHVPTIMSSAELHRRKITNIALAAGTAGIAVVLLLIVA
jgi:polysaccharide chain length determinant protein (PEP-CTERM system associated)